jgi:hypothetical protein
VGRARDLLKSLMRRNSAIFNPLWEVAFPLFRSDEIYYGAEYTDRREAFRTIYEQNRWGSCESRSGRGSTLAYTKPLRKSLARYLRKLKVEVLLDAPCGDFNWMRHVRLPDGVRYIGGDIVAPLIDELQRAHGNASYSFRTMDIVEDPLPLADLWICRDVLFHLSNADILWVFENFAASSIPHMLTTTYGFPKSNDDIRSGGFRFINLQLPPFGLPRPLSRTTDFVAPEPPRYLGLWSREQVAAALR